MGQLPFSKEPPGESHGGNGWCVDCVLRECVISKVGCSDLESGQVHFPSVKSNLKRVSFRIADPLIDMFLAFFLDILLAVQSSWDLNLIFCL